MHFFKLFFVSISESDTLIILNFISTNACKKNKKFILFWDSKTLLCTIYYTFYKPI